MKSVIDFTKEVLGIQLHPLQAEVLMGMASHQLVVWLVVVGAVRA
jgi:hypothetical protein